MSANDPIVDFQRFWHSTLQAQIGTQVLKRLGPLIDFFGSLLMGGALVLLVLDVAFGYHEFARWCLLMTPVSLAMISIAYRFFGYRSSAVHGSR